MVLVNTITSSGPPIGNAFSRFENYAAALLANVRDSSIAAGRRLLDVLDLHWYPDLYVPVTNENTDSVTVLNRIEVPRTLWDSTYVENGWIGQYYHRRAQHSSKRPSGLLHNSIRGLSSESLNSIMEGPRTYPVP